jgi:hypothetical protein
MMAHPSLDLPASNQLEENLVCFQVLKEEYKSAKCKQISISMEQKLM